MIPKENTISYEEFLKIDNSSDKNLEYINGIVYMQAAPSVIHQAVVTNLSTEFGVFLKGKDCRHFVSPFDVIFKSNEGKHKVQPDLTIICNKKGLNQNNYEGIPTIVVEVLSPSTTSRDYIEKMNLYMRYGVEEYWIISPKNKTVEIFTLQEGNTYSEPQIFSKDDMVQSNVFNDFLVNLQELFIL
ncbi:MAG: Uma2 family endonuclease [Clostridia bacterium]|nr:Uma2 family endonuclease [Clostridia bacterium]